jgi:hypothetical protein
MRYGILVCVVGLALALDLAVLISTSDDLLESFDPRHPSTLVPIVANRLHDLATAMGEVARDLVEWFVGPYRERLHHTLPAEPAPH